jgi:hypothetical protein
VCTCPWLNPHRYRAIAYPQDSRTLRSCRGVTVTVGTLGGGRWLGDRAALYARVRVGAARRDDRLGEIHSIDDRYDHDIDELMA